MLLQRKLHVQADDGVTGPALQNTAQRSKPTAAHCFSDKEDI